MREIDYNGTEKDILREKFVKGKLRFFSSALLALLLATSLPNGVDVSASETVGLGNINLDDDFIDEGSQPEEVGEDNKKPDTSTTGGTKSSDVAVSLEPSYPDPK